MKQFEVGNTYQCRSICDYNCIWSYTVIARTAATVTLRDNHTGKTQKNRIAGISKRSGIETVFPLGSYSMAPTLTAE